jgi:hypothetical protein
MIKRMDYYFDFYVLPGADVSYTHQEGEVENYPKKLHQILGEKDDVDTNKLIVNSEAPC